jgi:hypothetical protein
LLHFETGQPLTYNKEDLQNPYFVAKRLWQLFDESLKHILIKNRWP